MKKIILALYILYLPFQLKLPQTPIVNTINLFLILLTAIFISAKNYNTVKIKFEKPLLIFLIIWILSFAHTLMIPEGIWGWEATKEFKRLITLVFGYYVVVRCVRTKKDLLFLFYIFLISIVLVALSTWRNGILAGPHFSDAKRSAGPFGTGFQGADIAGGFLAIFTPFLLSLILVTQNKALKFIGFMSLIICLVGIFTTYSRGSIMALGIASIVTILTAVKFFLKRSKLTVAIILLVLIGLVLRWQSWVPESIIHRANTTLKEGEYEGVASLDKSSQGRIDIWNLGLELFYRSPFTGVGFKRPQYELGVDTHNAYILIAAEMGIFGLLAFLWFLWRVFRESTSLVNTDFNFLGIGFVGCITAFIFVNMFYANFFRDTVVGSFWVVLGILTASKRIVILETTGKKRKIINA